jgi:ArsR family transcriptional regulator
MVQAAVGVNPLNESGSQETVKILKALANPIRLRMIASLYDEPKNVYALAKQLSLPYPLAYLHLDGLKKRGLVKEIREVKKVEGLPSIKYYAPSDFELHLTPQSIRKMYPKRKEMKE